MKVFKSSSWSVEFTGTRAEAIAAAIEWVKSRIAANLMQTGPRFAWRAEDGSGFNIATSPRVECVAKWNASRFDW